MKFTRTELKKIFVQKAIQELGMNISQTTLEELKELIKEDYETTRLFELYEKLLEIQRDYEQELKYDYKNYGITDIHLKKQLSDLQERILEQVDLLELDNIIQFNYRHNTDLLKHNFDNEDIKNITETIIDAVIDNQEEWGEYNFKDLLK